MRRFLKDEGEWFDEHLLPAGFTMDRLVGHMVMLHSLEPDEMDMFMVKDDEAYIMITHAPDGSVLDVVDHLDTNPPFGLA